MDTETANHMIARNEARIANAEEHSGLRHKTIIGRERALLDGLTVALQRVVGGPPASKKTIAELHRHNSSRPNPTLRGSTFEVQIVGPAGEITGHIVRVTVELDRFEAPR